MDGQTNKQLGVFYSLNTITFVIKELRKKYSCKVLWLYCPSNGTCQLTLVSTFFIYVFVTQKSSFFSWLLNPSRSQILLPLPSFLRTDWLMLLFLLPKLINTQSFLHHLTYIANCLISASISLIWQQLSFSAPGMRLGTCVYSTKTKTTENVCDCSLNACYF